MFFEYCTFSIAKDTRRPSENQDACAVDAARGLAAIADGVSSTLFAGRWARLLVEGVIASPPAISDAMEFSAWLDQLRHAWRAEIETIPLAWHQKPKRAQGAASTLLWIELSQTDRPSEFNLQSYAVGDCCLFLVQRDQVQRAFPIETSADFNTAPDCLHSVSRVPETSPQFQTLQVRCRAGDLIVLCTDAIAVWALKEQEAGRAPEWDLFWPMSAEDWHAKIENLRKHDGIRYDDTTLVLLRVAEPDETEGTDRAADLIANLRRTAKRMTAWIRGTPSR
ncbi:MAG: protein phosphatase 2C domain-containing protein [Planctomycetota bacterium]|nr:protein phosphatase 2C domain-containing protein [Planctomycetota bacterium]